MFPIRLFAGFMVLTGAFVGAAALYAGFMFGVGWLVRLTKEGSGDVSDAEETEDMFGGTFHAFDAWLETRPDLANAGMAAQLDAYADREKVFPWRKCTCVADIQRCRCDPEFGGAP